MNLTKMDDSGKEVYERFGRLLEATVLVLYVVELPSWCGVLVWCVAVMCCRGLLLSCVGVCDGGIWCGVSV